MLGGGGQVFVKKIVTTKVLLINLAPTNVHQADR